MGLVKKRGDATMREVDTLSVSWIFVSNQTRGYLEDQEKHYGLGYIISDSEQAIEKAIEKRRNF